MSRSTARQAAVPTGTATDYHYDPTKAANRRTTAYSSTEFRKLPKDQQQRVLRNRQTAAASKARKRQRLRDLQDLKASLQAEQNTITLKLDKRKKELERSQLKTFGLLRSCGCDACKNLLGVLEAAAASSTMP
eukprot:gene5165-5403_t